MPASRRIGLRISNTLTLPDDTITETLAIIARRGMGKTHSASVLAEEMIAAGLPVLIVDPLGVWWGLRSSADGKSDGLPVVIFGGDHADVPLTEQSANLIADAVVEHRFPAILDLSHLSKSAARRFMTPFLERVYHRNRDPLHVFFDEADLWAPQRATAGENRLLGAVEDLQRRGRARGLGTTVITQRPAVLHKDVLSQASVLIAFGMTGPRDVAAIDEWVRLHANDDQAREVKGSLPSLPVGTAWVWSPGFLGVLEKVQIRPRRTYDSSATPKVGTRREPVRRMTPIDLDRLGDQIAHAAKEAEANDPKALRRRIAELEARLAAGPSERVVEEVRVEVPVEVPVLTDEERALLEALLGDGSQTAEDLAGLLDRLTTGMDGLTAALQRATTTANSQRAGGASTVIAKASPATSHRVREAANGAPGSPRPTPATRTQPRAASGDPDTSRPLPTGPSPTPAAAQGSTGDRSLAKAERKILHVLATHGTRTTTQVAILAGYSHKSGGYRNALSSLRTAGLIDGRGEVTITPAGLDALGEYEELPSGSQLRAWWQANHLGKAERAIVEVLAADYPAPVPVPDIAERTGYSATSGGFRNALSRLRTLELATGRGELVLNEALADA